MIIMKKFTLLKIILMSVFMLGSLSFYGQTNIFTVAGGGTLPTNWTSTNNVTTNDIDKSTYYLLDAGSPGDIIETGNYDLSAYDKLTINVKVATYGSGTANPMKIEYSTDGGSNWISTTYTTATPSSSTYIDGGPIEIIGTFSSTVRFRFSNAGISGRGVRIQNLTLDAVNSASPVVEVTETIIPGMTTDVDATTTETINVSGTNLTENISITITGTNSDQFSVSPNSITQTGGTASETSVTVTYHPDAVGTHTAVLEVASSGATTVTRNLSGIATLATPIAIDASSISETGFTVNWNAVGGAASYDLNVYTKAEGTINASDLFISEYGEGSSNNKYIEIYNGTGAPVDLSSYTLKQAYNGGGWDVDLSYTLPLSGTLNDGDVYVIANADANATVLAQADLTIAYSSSTQGGRIVSFTGNDAVGLFKNGSLIDIFGDPNSSDNISVAGYSTWAYDHTLVRKASVTSPTTDWTTSSGTNETDSQWEGYAQDTWTYLGWHTMTGHGIISTPITGSPFEGLTSTSQVITGLISGTTYYYNVIAKNGTVTSLTSNEIETTTSGTLTELNQPKDLNLFASNGKIIFNTENSERVIVYNSVGQQIVNTLSVEGRNEVSVPNAKGMYIVKVGTKTTKVVL